MPQKQITRMPFPVGGRVDRYAYQSQPPYTTVSALNVWPDAMGRERGGSRPGFTRAYTQNLGASIVAVGTINYVPDGSSNIISRLVAIETGGAIYGDNGVGSTTIGNLIVQAALTTTDYLGMSERNQKLYIAGHSVSQSLSETTYKLSVYDPVAGTCVPVVATDGTIPRGCRCICTWRDRIVLAGGTTTPYGVFMSRQGDETDWDYSEEDAGAAVDLGVANAGQIGDTVTSLTPHADNCLIIGCPSQLWLLQGDPRDGGQLANLSMAVGVVGPAAWCTTPDGMFVFLSHDGLYGVPAGCSSSGNPVSISRERLPLELLNLDTRDATGAKHVSLAYDTRHRGIYIFISDRSSANTDDGNSHWFFDWEAKSFWPIQFQEARMDPWCCHARPN